MNLLYQLDQRVDLKQFRKLFLCFSLLPLVLIPADGLWMTFQKTQPSRPSFFAGIKEGAHESLSSYQGVFEKSSLFGNIANAPLVADRVSIAELVKDYRLKGVVITDEPEAMVEDARTQKINYLRKGSKVGELTVKEIKEGLLVLIYGTQETRLEIQ